jgi:CheY-like chemotaxis protein
MAKILLVEDDKSLREIYGVRLQAEGYTIISAGDGEEALAVAIKERPDLIVSDVMMPKISGFDMLDILRSTTETKDIKVIMMTALSSEDQRARGEALGADRYLVKSQVGIEDVVRTVHDVLGDGIATSEPVAPVAAPAFAPAPASEAIAAAPVAPVADIPAPIAAPAPFTPPAFEATPPVVEPAPITAPVAPALAPVEPIAPVAPAFIPEPIPAPVPVAAPVIPAPVLAEPVAPIAPVFAAPAPAPVAPAPTPVTFPPSVTLPQPTAPFSSDPPASLGDRIINPLPSADSLGNPGVADIAAQMNQELNAHLAGLQQPATAPVAPVAPAPVAAPTQYATPPQPPVPPLPPQPGI